MCNALNTNWRNSGASLRRIEKEFEDLDDSDLYDYYETIIEESELRYEIHTRTISQDEYILKQMVSIMTSIDGTMRKRNMTVISEPAIDAIMWTARSKEAVKFRRFMLFRLLPTIYEDLEYERLERFARLTDDERDSFLARKKIKQVAQGRLRSEIQN